MLTISFGYFENLSFNFFKTNCTQESEVQVLYLIFCVSNGVKYSEKYMYFLKFIEKHLLWDFLMK